MKPSRRSTLIAVVTALAVGGGIALAVALQGGGQPGPGTTTPISKIGAPSHNPPQSPPWGFTGGGWLDICYGPVATPGLSRAPRVPDGRSCRPGSTRLTGATQIALTARAGADTDRIEALWSSIEPLPPSEAAARGVPRFNWAPVVSRYRTMVADGIRPIVVAFGAPPWARAPGWDRPAGCSGCSYPPAPRHIAEWRAFVRGLMAHLPGMGALEVWNEPNYASFFAPRANPGLYARLLRAADDAARQAHFHRPILTGGLSPGSSAGGKMPEGKFLSRVYELAGKRSFDGIGAHPYPSRSPWAADMTAKLQRLRRVSEHFGDGAKPLWITEVGIGGGGGGGHFNVPLERQGPVLARMYRAAQGMNIRSFLIYTLSDTGASASRFATYGVLTPALRPKPAYCYLAQRVGQTRACPLPRLTRTP
jgi:polysaccharide biosynthesis protein PslG